MPVHTFGKDEDAKFYRRRCAEMHRLYHKPRKWLIHARDTTPLNIYGEPGEIVTNIDGTDGVTSVPATRQFTSASSLFLTADVRPGDSLVIKDNSCDNDNGRYEVESVDTETQLTITEDWPRGSTADVEFSIEILKERYAEFPQLVPFLVKLSPTKKELTKWGLDEDRDAKIVMSIELLEQLGLTPKIGDRFEYPYEGRIIQYELKNLFEADQLGDDGEAITLVGFALRTTDVRP